MLRSISRYGHQVSLVCRAGHHTAAAAHGGKPVASPICEHDVEQLTESIHRMALRLPATLTDHVCASQCSGRTISGKEYILPTIISNTLSKKTILDPVITPQIYKLPTHLTVLKEKVSPALENNSPKTDPDLLQKIIDQGAPVLRKEAARLVMIRHKKMKKHKLRKLRKRMYFANKKVADIKKKKKEKIMLLMEKEFREMGEKFDAEQFVEERIALAKKGGWGVNIFESRR